MSDFDRLMGDSLKAIRDDHVREIESQIPAARWQIATKIRRRRFTFVIGAVAVAAVSAAVALFITQSVPNLDRSLPPANPGPKETSSTSVPSPKDTLENEDGPGERYDIVDGEVTFAATYPWRFDPDWVADSPRTMAALTADFGGIRIVADPLPVGTGCEADAAPADAQAWAERILSDPEIEPTEPTPIRIAGLDALQMDVAPAAGASICDSGDEPVLFNSSEHPHGGWRSQVGLWHRHSHRVYLLDVPAGSSRILAVVVFGFDRDFDEVVEAAAPVLDSLEFHEE